MSGGKQVFRPEALARLSSPEQLDELMVVTDAKEWVALSALGFLLLIALAWSVFGSVPTSIQGSGVLLRQGGIYDIQATGAGQVLSVLTSEDSLVQKDQLLGYVAQPELVAQIAVAREERADLIGRRDREISVQDQSLQLKLTALAQDSVRLAGEIVAQVQHVSWLGQRLRDTRFAQEQGLVTGEAVASIAQQLAAAESQLTRARTQLTDLQNQRIQVRHLRETEVGSLEQQLERAESRLRLLTGQLTAANEIRSPYRGRVTQVMLDEGQIITAGTPVASIERIDRPLEAVIFIPTVGAKARPGLTAHVQPLTVNWQEHGFMVGHVTFVSSGPVTVERMERLLKNEVLSRQFTSTGDPYLLEVSLDRAPTPTGYQWTSGQGPAAAAASIHGGILCTAKIIVETQRPITLVIPALRKFFGF